PDGGFRAAEPAPSRDAPTLAGESQAESCFRSTGALLRTTGSGTADRAGALKKAMTARLPVLINRNGGTAAARGEALAAEVAAAFEQANQPIELELLDGNEIPAAVRRHARAPRIAVGGGDGTLSAAAAELACSPGAMAILPLGTRNH